MYQVNGVLLACEADGPPDGPPVLLLHALGEDRGSWRAVSAGLAADGWRTLAPDLRGHGDSGHPGAYAFESMRDDVLALLDALRLETVTVVAHSLGTIVASLVAMDRPWAVRRMVLEEGPLPYPADPPRPVPGARRPGRPDAVRLARGARGRRAAQRPAAPAPGGSRRDHRTHPDGGRRPAQPRPAGPAGGDRGGDPRRAPDHHRGRAHGPRRAAGRIPRRREGVPREPAGRGRRDPGAVRAGARHGR
ncbi:alpha/beta fold hydrolase [Actinacidiphila rubida]